jgi:imidazolonepropionase-like amidohydrolase
MSRPRSHITRLLVAATLLAAGAPALGQSRQIPAPPQNDPIVIRGAIVHTVAGPSYEPGYVRFDGGLITDVGRGRGPDDVDAETRVIDADGLHVYPGRISPDTLLGLVETGSVAVTRDYDERGDVTPEVWAAVAINPDTDLIPVTRANGILTALIYPRGGLVSGRASLIRLDGWTWEQMAIEPSAGLVLNWPQTETRRGRWYLRGGGDDSRDRYSERMEAIERLFDDAVAYIKAREARPELPADLRLESMRPVLAGEMAIFLRATSRSQIESAIAWAQRREVRIVIVGGSEADQVAELLARYDVPVILSGVHRMPRHRDEPYDTPFTLPGRLYEAGVRFAIASGSGAAHERNLNHNAGTAVAFGLPQAEALKCVTLRAAEIIGLGATHGSLESGKAATLIVTTGDPLQITTDTLLAFIDGREVDLGNRHKALYEKYRQKYLQLGLLGAEFPEERAQQDATGSGAVPGGAPSVTSDNVEGAQGLGKQ